MKTRSPAIEPAAMTECVELMTVRLADRGILKLNMKTKLLISSFALAIFCSAAELPNTTLPGNPKDLHYTLEYRGALTTNDFTPKIEAKLQWVVVTNWTDENFSTTTAMAWTGNQNPNITTHFEHGSVCSNLMATVEWKGQPKSVLLESIPFNTLQRAYTIKTTTERIYR